MYEGPSQTYMLRKNAWVDSRHRLSCCCLVVSGSHMYVMIAWLEARSSRLSAKLRTRKNERKKGQAKRGNEKGVCKIAEDLHTLKIRNGPRKV